MLCLSHFRVLRQKQARYEQCVRVMDEEQRFELDDIIQLAGPLPGQGEQDEEEEESGAETPEEQADEEEEARPSKSRKLLQRRSLKFVCPNNIRCFIRKVKMLKSF